MSSALVRPARRQHTVSRVVVRRFTLRNEISVFDRVHRSVYRKGPGGVFYDRLDRHDPFGAEKRWGQVETKLPRVYQLIDARTVLDAPDAVETLRDLIAMHWIRTPALRLPHERAKAKVASESIADLDNRPDLLARALKQRSGLVPGSNADLAWVNRSLHARALGELEHQMLSDSLARNFLRAREMLARRHVQVAYSSGLDFVIGDAPVITRKEGHDGLGLHQGVALGDAIEIAMPISPTVLIGLGPRAEYLAIEDAAVARYNDMQASFGGSAPVPTGGPIGCCVQPVATQAVESHRRGSRQGCGRAKPPCLSVAMRAAASAPSP